MEKMAVFFLRRGECYQAYHKSITDWLCGRAGRSTKYRQCGVGPSTNRRPAARSVPRRAIRQIHVDPSAGEAYRIASQQWQSLETLLTNLDFIEAECRAGMIYELQADFDAALDALPRASSSNATTTTNRSNG